MVFRLPDTRRKRNKRQKHHRNPIILAREWQEAIEKGKYKSQAELARRKGISRARVTQILNLLKLDAQVQEMIARLGDPLSSHSVTERKLRPIVGLRVQGQLRKTEPLFRKGAPT